MRTINVIEGIFFAALEKANQDERAAYLDAACAGDAELRRAVERMLAAHPNVGAFLQVPAPGLPMTADHVPLEEKVGVTIGPYKLLQELGEGGFGVVFMAEQTEPVRRKVALKVIKPGMDSRQVVARFEQERQALAMMDHPNIAKVLDGGTTESGRPYFVMELVKGVPITTFCDDNRLSPRERLELFAQVCAAIAHAHTKGVIHRDVKPSNVLVTIYDGKPSVKVIDFGVAKAVEQPMTDKTLFTRHGQVIGTLEYMSPEQASLDSLDVDTRSDVYALGVLLYELLTGSTPLDKDKARAAGFAEMLRLIREEEPPLPSVKLSASGEALPALAAFRKCDSQRLPKLVRGELDWIAMRALEKDRARRYQSATGLAEDVARYLRDEPVLACPPTWRYRAGKLLRKHRAAFTLAGTAAALLLLGAVVSGWQAWRASRAELRAIHKAQDAEKAQARADDEADAAKRERDAAMSARLATRRAFYAQSMTLIPIAWQANDTRCVAQLLDGLRPGPDEEDLRGFEWHHWDRQLHQERRSVFVAETRPQQEEALNNSRSDFEATLSGDGTRVAIPCYPNKDGDPVLKVIEPVSGNVLFSVPSQEGRRRVFSLTLSHDGRRLGYLLANPNDREGRTTVEVWDVDGKSDRPLFTRKAQKVRFNRGMAFSPAGDRLVISEAGEATNAKMTKEESLKAQSKSNLSTVKVWDLTPPNGEAIFQTVVLNTRYTYAPLWAFSPDGSRLALASSNTRHTEVELWEVATGKKRSQTSLEGHGDALAFSPDGKRLAGGGIKEVVAEKGNGVELPAIQVRVWEGADADELKSVVGNLNSGTNFGAAGFVSPLRKPATLVYSPDGKTLALFHGGSTVHLFRATGQETRVLKAIGQVKAVAFGEGGKRLSALVSDQAFSRVNRWTWMEWDLAAAQETRPASEPKAVVYERSSAQSLTRVRWQWLPPAEEIAVRSPDGERLARYVPSGASGPRGAITVTDLAGKEVHVFRRQRAVTGVTFSPNGRFVLSEGIPRNKTGNALGYVVWETDTGKVRLEGSKSRSSLESTGIEFVSPDGRLLVLPGDKGVRVVHFDAPDKERFTVGDAAGAYFADERHLVCVHRKGNLPNSPVREIKVWDVEAGRELSSHSPDEVELAFGSDGGYFLVRKQEESTLLEEIGAKQRRIRLKGTGNAGDFRMLRFSPDGARLVTTPKQIDRNVMSNRVWDANSGEELYRIEGPRVQHLVFSPDGKRLVGWTLRDRALNVWDAVTGQVLLTLRTQEGGGGGTLAFSPDGHRLTLKQYPGSYEHVWDATPRLEQPIAPGNRE